MKKSFILGMLFFLAFGLTVNAHALLTPGTYDLLTGLGNGSWAELLNFNGGVPKSTFFASGPGWNFDGTCSSFNGASGQYQINSAKVVSGDWGDDVHISNVVGTKLSTVLGDKLEWHFTFTGSDNENPSIPIHFTAHFDSITPTTPASGVTYVDFGFGHGGKTFSELKMTVAPIPAAAWLLGSGLIGLAVIRRRMRN
jgi:hypothetical protein